MTTARKESRTCFSRMAAVGLLVQSHLRRWGFRSLARRVSIRIARQFGWDIGYQVWTWFHSPSRADLAAQSRRARITQGLPECAMIVLLDGNMRTKLLSALCSLRRQTNPNWSSLIVEDNADPAMAASPLGDSGCDYVPFLPRHTAKIRSSLNPRHSAKELGILARIIRVSSRLPCR
jgi:hypothetical protein